VRNSKTGGLRPPRRAGAQRPREHASAQRAPRAIGVAIVTVSDTRRGADDTSGALAESLLAAAGAQATRDWVKDDVVAIRRAVRAALAKRAIDVIVLTGGTGVAPRDVTPEATRTVLEREVPGIAEALRADAFAKTPHGLLSRGTAGIVGRALVVNLPGSPGGCRDGYALLRPALPHALALISDEPTRHRQT